MFYTWTRRLPGAAVLLVGPALLVCATAHAQTPEVRRDKQELRENRAQTRDDWLDLKRLEGLLARFDRARATNNANELNICDTELRWLVNTELGEGRKEIAQDRREVGRDTREVREGRREAWETGDRGEVREERRERRDDVRDTKRKIAMHRERRRIALELQALAARRDPAALDRKRALTVEMINLARHELGQDVRERREDRREMREDRRRE